METDSDATSTTARTTPMRNIEKLKILQRDPMAEKGAYRDQRFVGSREEQDSQLDKTHTLYVGNLSFWTSEEQLHDLFY